MGPGETFSATMDVRTIAAAPRNTTIVISGGISELICFVRNFRTNATPCPDFGCPNLHMECPTCRGIINVCPNLAAWCQDNYETIDMIEYTMQSGGTITFVDQVFDGRVGGGTVTFE